MPNLIPYLTFRHGEESLRFLVECLGFEPTTVQEDDGRYYARRVAPG
jgi:uncharacterized glyoxalase superfamily protein PhnB